MTLDDIELGNGRFNRVRLSIEDDLKIIDDVVLKYKPEIVDLINSGFFKFTSFQREPLTREDIKKYNRNNINIDKFIINEPILAFYTVDVVLDVIKSEIHGNRDIFKTNTLLDKIFGYGCLTKCFSRDLEIIESITERILNVNEEDDIVLSTEDMNIIYKAFDRIWCKVTDYTGPFPNGVFDFDYTRNYVDLIYVDDIYSFRYNEAIRYLDANMVEEGNYEGYNVRK